MGDNKNLSGTDAFEKIKELAADKMCLFCTYEDQRIVSRPMSTTGIDEDGTLWFISNKQSLKNEQIANDPNVCLLYSEPAKSHYLSLSGTATIVEDKAKLDELWNPLAKVWFEQGKDDPNISLLKVTPTDGHYWDTKNGKLITLLKIGISAVTGNTADGGIEGDLTL